MPTSEPGQQDSASLDSPGIADLLSSCLSQGSYSISRGLKPAVFLPPLAALLLVTGWGLRLNRESSTLEEEIAARRQRLAALQQAGAPATGVEALAAAARQTALDRIHAIDPAKMDWEKIGNGYRDEHRYVLEQIYLWSKEQLFAALDHLPASGLSEDDRDVWQTQLLWTLCDLDPQAALQWSIDHPAPNGQTSYKSQEAIQSLAEADPVAAIAWLDRQIAAGTVDPKANPSPFSNYERCLFKGLLRSDPAAAATRLATLPAEVRDTLLSMPMESVPIAVAQAGLLRDSLPANQHPQALAKAFVPMLRQGEAASAALLDRMAATPEERRAVAEGLVETHGFFTNGAEIAPARVGKLRDWLSRQAPDEVESLTARILIQSKFAWDIDLEQTSAVALHYDPDGSRGLLVEYLRHLPAQTGEDLTPLIGKIADPVIREELRQRFAK
ncbi:MAG: hypothetical protein JWO82_1973 [Akkermansiaceae bacterium]|nr:hypothetical protein [Akkermansiaceae bacterium]